MSVLKAAACPSRVSFVLLTHFLDINLRNQNFYHHILNEKNRDDYVAYGVKFENMRKVLIIRAPFVFNNLTDVTYSMRLLKNDGSTVIKTVNLIPEQCYPIDFKEIIECRFQLSCEGGEWSSPIRIKTIVEKVPKNATVRLIYDLKCMYVDVPLSWKVIYSHNKREE